MICWKGSYNTTYKKGFTIEATAPEQPCGRPAASCWADSWGAGAPASPLAPRPGLDTRLSRVVAQCPELCSEELSFPLSDFQCVRPPHSRPVATLAGDAPPAPELGVLAHLPAVP